MTLLPVRATHVYKPLLIVLEFREAEPKDPQGQRRETQGSGYSFTVKFRDGTDSFLPHSLQATLRESTKHTEALKRFARVCAFAGRQETEAELAS